MNFTLITCTYNPNQFIFIRLIKSIENLKIPKNSKVEWIIVDNNSPNRVAESDYIKDFLFRNKFTRIILEKTQGLTSSRIAGIKESKYDWLVFFDDDNEPQEDFLEQLNELLPNYPEVVCWGPGRIRVEFTDETNNKWILTKKEVFQEKNFNKIQKTNIRGWHPYYPVGTGLVAHKDILLDYINKINIGIYTLTDRKGKSLISGGDTQIVLNAQKLGFYAGIAPGLCLNHLINKGKANYKYILRQKYWTASSYIKCYNEVYEDEPIRNKLVGNLSIIRALIKSFYYMKKAKRASLKDSLYHLVKVGGEINALYLAEDKKSPFILRLIEKLIS